jgi:hypothetical protein
MNGVDIYTASKLLRHRSVKTSERYAHLSDSHLQDAVERLTGDPRGGTAPEIPAQNSTQRLQ